MTKHDRLQETLKSWRRTWRQFYDEDGKRRKAKGTPLDTNLLQDSWNTYMRANISYHGKYVAASDPNFLKHGNSR